MKKIIRLTESELRDIVKSSVNRILREDVLGNDWNVNDEGGVFNNYEPFEDQEEDDNEEYPFGNKHDWGVNGEENIDPTQYDDYDPIEQDPEYYFPEEVDDSDWGLLHGGY